MDKSWMLADRRSQMFSLGVDELLMYALESGCDMEKICCPCLKCFHGNCWTARVVKNHLIEFGIDESYKKWIWHGEGDSDGSSSIPRHNDPSVREPPDQGSPSVEGSDDGEFSTDSDDFMEFVEDGDKPLYPGCTRFTKMTALVKTHELKAKHGITDSCFWDMLLLIGKLLPEGNEVPSSLYMAKKALTILGLSYEKIHSCPNDCILYRGTDLEATSCRICGLSRWKLGNDQSERFGVPAKVLWYFPPIPRFKKMFQSFSTAKNLSWHANERLKDDKMRHPADSPTWKLVDEKWPSFGAEPRNLRLALSSDGFNPHSSLSSKYSCWPVILVIYNLPPWLCMKRKYMMLTLLIQGPKQPGDDIETVGGAVGTFVAWPRDFILQSASAPSKKKKGKGRAPSKAPTKAPAKAVGRPSKKRKKLTDDDDNDDNLTMDLKKLPADYPAALKCLWIWGNDALADGKTVLFMLTCKVFGVDRKQYLYKRDMHVMCTMGKVSGGILCMYMLYLHELLKKSKMLDMVAFVDPNQIGAVNCGNVEQRARKLSIRFSEGQKGQLFLLPYNSGKHWTLSVVSLEDEVIYSFDPVKRRLLGDENWKNVVESAIKIYKSQMDKPARDSITWVPMMGVPQQHGDEDCGFFVMRYMKDIIQDRNLEFVSKWKVISNPPLEYTRKQIDEVRSEWAKYVLKFHAK